MKDSSSLARFLHAQARDYEQALAEIKNGKKRSHWMWFVFPQISGLGLSETSRFYAINNKDEAKAFLDHPVLGKRLIEICNELLKLSSNDAGEIFGSPDNLKLKSSMTLFSVLDTNNVFQAVLDKFFNGKKDDKTLKILSEE